MTIPWLVWEGRHRRRVRQSRRCHNRSFAWLISEGASGARAVRIAHGFRRGARKIEHLGSAHDEKALEALKATARQRLANLIRVGSGLQAE